MPKNVHSIMKHDIWLKGFQGVRFLAAIFQAIHGAKKDTFLLHTWFIFFIILFKSYCTLYTEPKVQDTCGLIKISICLKLGFT